VSTRDPLVGTTVGGRYEVMSVIGRGATSIVYLVRDVTTGKDQALKALRALDAQARRRLVREMQAVDRIVHPNIVRLSDIGEGDDGTMFLVMEYVRGFDLATVISNDGLEPIRAIRIAEQIASALEAAHAKGVVHRDLKPENVLLVDTEGARDVVKILDFGIAKVAGAPSLTATGWIVGTPGFIAPEALVGAPIDNRSDIYSFGVLLYEMLTATLPYDATGSSELVVKTATSDPITLRDRKPSLPAALETFVMRCLEKSPGDRPQDASEVLRELATLGADSGVGP